MSIALRLALTPLTLLLLGSACAPETGGAPPLARPDVAAVADADQIDALIAELNAARRDPRAYARRVRDYRALFRGRVFQVPGRTAVVTQEGVAAVDEAIRFLERQAPLPALIRTPELDRAAALHAADQGRSGRTGHVGSDGSSPHDRIRRTGDWRATAETISYGSPPDEAVMQLLVDDGVPDRGHRAIFFSTAVSRVGAACGPHPTWRTVCVIDFAAPSAGSPTP